MANKIGSVDKTFLVCLNLELLLNNVVTSTIMSEPGNKKLCTGSDKKTTMNEIWPEKYFFINNKCLPICVCLQ